MPDVGYYTLPVILSFQGVDKQVNQALGSNLKTAGTRGGQEFAKGLAGGVKRGEADVKRSLDRYSKLYDKTADSAGKVRSEQAKLNDLIDKGTTSGGRYVTQVERLETARRREVTATKDAKDAYAEYERAVKDAGRATDDAMSGGGGLGAGLASRWRSLAGDAGKGGQAAAAGFSEAFSGGIAGGIAASGGKIIDSLGKVGGGAAAIAVIATVGVTLGKMLANQFMEGVKREQSQANLAAALGLNKEQAAIIGKEAGQAYANNFTASLQDSMDIAKAAVQGGLVTSATDPALDKVIAQIDTVRTITGASTEEIVRAASNMVKTGMAKSTSDAMDLITRATQQGMNVSGDLLDTLNEYSVQFQKIGISGPKALGLVRQLMQAGVRDSDVAADALKEFSIRSVDGSKLTTAAYDAMGMNAQETQRILLEGGPAAEQMSNQIVANINKIEDPILRNNVGLALFGTQWEDIGNASKNLDFSTAEQTFGDYAGSTEDAAKTMGSTTVAAIEQMKRDIEGIVRELQDSLAEVFGPIVKKWAAEIREHTPEIKSALSLIADATLNLTADVLRAVGEMTVAWGQLEGGIGNTYGAMLRVDAFLQRKIGRGAYADELDREADAAFGWGASTTAAGNAMLDAADDIDRGREEVRGFAEDAEAARNNADLLATGIKTLPTGEVVLKEDTPEAIKRVEDLGYEVLRLPSGELQIRILYKDQNGRTILPSQLGVSQRQRSAAEGHEGPRRRLGGSIGGTGAGDIVPAMLEPGEHVLTRGDVHAMGGQGGVYAFRRGLHGYQRGGRVRGMAAGGAVGLDPAVIDRVNARLRTTRSLSGEIAGNVVATVRAGGQITLTTNSEEVQEQLAQIGLTTEELPDGTIVVKADTEEGEKAIADFREEVEDNPVTVSLASDTSDLTVPASGLGSAAAIGPGGNINTGGGGTPDKLTPTAAAVWRELRAAFPGMTLHGWGPGADHNNSKCIDAMVGDTPEGKIIGDRIAAHYLKDPRVQWVIWQQQMWKPGQAPRMMEDRFTRTKNHYDHPHIQTRMRRGGVPGAGSGDIVPALLEPGEHVLTKGDVAAMGGQAAVYAMRKGLHGYAGGGHVYPPGKVPDWDAIAMLESSGLWFRPDGDQDSTGGLQIQTRTWLDFGGDKYAKEAYLASKEQQIAIAEKIFTAQGEGAWAGGKNFRWKTAVEGANGTGTQALGSDTYERGTGPGGEAGYYEPVNPADVSEKKSALKRAQDEEQTQKDILETLKEQHATQAEIAAQEDELAIAANKRQQAEEEYTESQRGEFVAGEPPSGPPPTYRREPVPSSEITAAEGDVLEIESKITDLEGRIDDAITKRKEMDKPVPFGEEGPTAEEKAAADREIATMQDELAGLRRQKATAEGEVAELRKGRIVEGPDADRTADDAKTEYDAGIDQLGQLPGLLVNGLFESLGIGDIFPDFTQTPLWKSFAGGLSAFKGPIQGLVEGRLGIQQPGWQPGMPVPGSGEPGETVGGGGVPLPFGLPNIPLPEPPPAVGAPGEPGGPTTNVQIDASINNRDNTIGTDPNEFERRQRADQDVALVKSVGALWPGN